jgi:glycosyltransferase involved in cell wall biosynthesis
MGAPSPKVSIGLPVYNGENVVSRAIEAALSQTYSDIELVISDNCSTDDTADVCRSYASRDRRIVYSRTTHNLGAAGNFARLPQIARGEFFKWLSHDDSMAPDFVEKCLPLAERDASVITVAPLLNVVDRNGNLLTTVSSYTGRQAWSDDRLEQYLQMMDELAYCELHSGGADSWWKVMPLIMCAYLYALHRRALLLKTRLILPCLGADYVLAAELALHGKLLQLDEALCSFTVDLSRRDSTSNWNPKASQHMLKASAHDRLELFMSVRRRHFEQIRSAWSSTLPLPHKLRALEASTRPLRARVRGRLEARLSRALSH